MGTTCMPGALGDQKRALNLLELELINGCEPSCGYHMHLWGLWRPEESTESLRTGVTEGCEPSCGSWELNLGPLQDQQVILTTELSLQALLVSLDAFLVVSICGGLKKNCPHRLIGSDTIRKCGLVEGSVSR